ncbi:hypothetical protein DBR43_09245 [Pedobacter sp. KBW06]|uniref:hypothetical protein n=1 Tax=Pedobacter sp. KBW06 TaxID=2153359 RepID=UPI000F59A1AD|nr:hypothetical protein [Pedobacter sp. KBW06]RQO75519.1 hypothetical protein DBR43_09245 [Pedobacter sp. KBW06]
MKTSLKFILALPVVLISLSSFNTINTSKGEECQVVEVYEGITPETDAKALTPDGLKKLTVILKPAKLRHGKYDYKLKRLEKDLYKVVDKALYIETKYCNKYASRDDATLIIDSSYGSTKGKLIFK